MMCLVPMALIGAVLVVLSYYAGSAGNVVTAAVLVLISLVCTLLCYKHGVKPANDAITRLRPKIPSRDDLPL
ncbi:MAG: hypothetical protein ACHQTE_00780 [Candidatus Saccharimonadales bacterium]